MAIIYELMRTNLLINQNLKHMLQIHESDSYHIY